MGYRIFLIVMGFSMALTPAKGESDSYPYFQSGGYNDSNSGNANSFNQGILPGDNGNAGNLATSDSGAAAAAVGGSGTGSGDCPSDAPNCVIYPPLPPPPPQPLYYRGDCSCMGIYWTTQSAPGSYYSCPNGAGYVRQMSCDLTGIPGKGMETIGGIVRIPVQQTFTALYQHVTESACNSLGQAGFTSPTSVYTASCSATDSYSPGCGGSLQAVVELPGSSHRAWDCVFSANEPVWVEPQ